LKQPENQPAGAGTSTRCGHVLSTEEIQQIRLYIQKIVTPSWMTFVPANLGSASHGKLKADQWRILESIYIPISLILMWGRIMPGDKRSEQCRKILDVTISLLSAIVAVTSLKTSQRHANLYLQHLQAYLSGVTSLFPDYTFQPKHHMALHLPEYLLQYGPVHA
jgi:hypothetical protein